MKTRLDDFRFPLFFGICWIVYSILFARRATKATVKAVAEWDHIEEEAEKSVYEKENEAA